MQDHNLYNIIFSGRVLTVTSSFTTLLYTVKIAAMSLFTISEYPFEMPTQIGIYQFIPTTVTLAENVNSNHCKHDVVAGRTYSYLDTCDQLHEIFSETVFRY